MGNVAVVQGGDCDDGDRSAVRQLHSLLVNLCKVGIQRTRHGVLRRNLVHTVAHDGKCICIKGHVGEKHQHLFVLVDCEVFSSGKCHVGNKQTLHRRLFRGVYKRHDLVEGACAFKGVAEEQVVVVAEPHSSQDYLVHVRAECHVCHHLVVWLVRVGEERNFLA